MLHNWLQGRGVISDRGREELYACTQRDQGCSFWGSHRQVTMHTGVVYIHVSKILPFRTIPDSNSTSLVKPGAIFNM